MGRHSQSSSLSTTLVELGTLASKGLSSNSSGRRRAAGPAKTSVGPVVYRAGGVAAALSIAVSGGAYAATQTSGDDVKPLTETQAHMDAFGATSSSAEATGLAAEAEQVTVVTESEDVTDAYQVVEQESTTLTEGETKVETEGVDGLTRTTYRVTLVDGQEVSREPVSSVVVTQRVDQVVLVGTGTPQDVALAAAGDGTSAESAKSIAHAMMSSYGWDDSQFQCLVSLWERESNWNYTAQNASSGAYGIPQSLPGSKMGSVASDWATNPTTQITWGLGYISDRYGSPCGAWAHSESVGWY